MLRRLGAGGMGVVYAVHDGLRNEAVALKTLRRADPAEISRLKREFRSLADLAHPNVVCLHELVVEPDTCFFTMELVDGVQRAGLRPHTGCGRGACQRCRGQRADAGLVRSVLRQLVAGVSELHGKGKLHRDIKPSNIMVRPDGRVVILDFGLMSDARPGEAAADDRMAGTPAYLAPEHHAGADPSEASDWYAVGVTLYEALTGRLPFDGSWQELSWRKSHSDPLPPSSLQPQIPDDLNEICMGLLCRDPQRRLSGRDALGKLADGGARDRKQVDGAAEADAVSSSAARGSWASSPGPSRRSKRAGRRPSVFTAPLASARPRWSSGSSTRCRATMPWCSAADATSTRRCHMRRSMQPSTV